MHSYATHKQTKKAPKQKAASRVYNDDDVFFHKGQVRVGAVFRYVGRLDPNSLWRVTKIVSYERVGVGEYKEMPATAVRRLDDNIYLVRDGAPSRTRAMTFSYMSYSAIWRVAK
jgi:hypothetical protein